MPQHDLHALREAAHARDPEGRQFLLKSLLLKLEFFGAMAVATAQVYPFMDAFEAQYPEETWPRQLIMGIVNFGHSPDEAIPEMALQQDFTMPGAGNFLKAIHDIAQSMQSRHQFEARVGFLVSATVNGVMAQVVHGWYGDRPDDWARVRANRYDPAAGTYSDPEATQIAYQFWTDERTARHDQQLWLAVADNIERELARA